MNEKTVRNIEIDTAVWLQEFFEFTTPKIENIKVSIISQTVKVNESRRLRALNEKNNFWKLILEMSIQGNYHKTSVIKNSQDADFEVLVLDYFNADKNTFLTFIKIHSYFEDANEVILSSSTKNINAAVNNEPESGTTKDNRMIIIIASALSGVTLLVFVFAAFIFMRGKRQRSQSTEINVAQAADDDSLFRPISNTPINQEPSSTVWKDTQPSKPVYRVRSRDSSKNENVDDATDSGQTYNTLEKLYSHDSMSYQSFGYSLESGVRSRSSLKSSDNESQEGEPLQIDLYGLKESSSYVPGNQTSALEVSMTSPASNYSGLTNEFSKAGEEDIKNQSMNTNIAVGSSTPTGSRGNELNNAPKYRRVCMAPPGRLGVVIDTTKRGTVIHQVKSGSPLENVVFAGDQIIKIDEFDTNGMTASAVTKIMATKMDQKRKITVLSSKDV